MMGFYGLGLMGKSSLPRLREAPICAGFADLLMRVLRAHQCKEKGV